MLVTAWWLPGAVTGSIVADLIAGALLIALSLPRGPIRQCYGGWDRSIR